MSLSIAKALITYIGIPHTGNTSWPQRLEYLTQHSAQNQLDYLICGLSDKPYTSAKTKRIICADTSRLAQKIFKTSRFKNFENTLVTLAKQHDYVIACIVDSVTLKNALYESLKAKKLDKKVKLVYYQCGFSYYFSQPHFHRFERGIAEIILLSHSSYQHEFSKYPDMPYPVHILHNPINHQLFYPLPLAKKMEVKKQVGFEEGKVHFIWVSQDKPVKGLQVIQEAWKIFYHQNKQAMLHVIGVKTIDQTPGIQYWGKLPNNQLPPMYQAADVFVFSPMRNEGFGLAVAEAISCGCFVISTYAGGITDFFKHNQHGIAIAQPNFLANWTLAFAQAMEQLPGFQSKKEMQLHMPPPFDTYESWCQKFMQIFKGIELRLVGNA